MSKSNGGGEVLTVDEVAVALRINRNTAYRAVHDGTIPSIRIGHRFLVPRVRLDAMLKGEKV